MPTCPKCGKDYELTKGDKVLRRSIGLAARAVPVMKDSYENSKDYCNDCFKSYFQDVGKIILGTIDQIRPALDEERRANEKLKNMTLGSSGDVSGWAMPPHSQEYHYFDENGLSLCGTWGYHGEYAGISDKVPVCSICKEKRDSRKS